MMQALRAAPAPAGSQKPAFFFFGRFFTGWLLFLTLAGQAQNRIGRDVDTAYVQIFRGKLTARTFLSQKYTSFVLSTPLKQSPSLRFRPNSALDLGIGATFGALTLNLSYGLSFLNQNNGKGKTRDIDLQTHVYMRKWVVDGFGQFYSGYFLAPRGKASSDPDRYYQRPDLGVRMVGGSLWRVLNFRRFSFRAALVQNERQKQSAGSWLMGFQLYYGVMQGDSALVPGVFQAAFPDDEVRRMRFIKVGPCAGYAYTYVFRERWFATGSLTANLNATFSKETFEAGKLTAGNVRPDFLFRAVAGYNSNQWCVTLGWVNGSVAVRSPVYRYTIHTGNYRFTVARRFKANSRMRKMVPETIKIL
ncbi:hypothetical protein GCM10028803_55470 [Larkinella knui]|uniref:DUF4421 domain-containing protein n=1 Tax=Larkinella knui TaxID=2025310 RepID=A0A3P1CGE6_9BACT|nr:DUF4421 domain-containing protein [Larkinella knui]RRB12258.1 DUF4421 domain-containing protein [Larkinella knui]